MLIYFYSHRLSIVNENQVDSSLYKYAKTERSKTNITGNKVELKRSIEHNVCTNVNLASRVSGYISTQ